MSDTSEMEAINHFLLARFHDPILCGLLVRGITRHWPAISEATRLVDLGAPVPPELDLPSNLPSTTQPLITFCTMTGEGKYYVRAAYFPKGDTLGLRATFSPADPVYR